MLEPLLEVDHAFINNFMKNPIMGITAKKEIKDELLSICVLRIVSIIQ
jgi:hypothetical protein